MKKPIRVLVITTWFPNISNINLGIFVKKLTEAQLRYSDIDITVVSPLPNIPKIMIPLLPGRLKKIFRTPFLVQEKNYNVYYPKYLKLGGLLTRYFDWYTYYHAVKNLIINKKLEFDLIHSHGLLPDSYVAMKISKYFNVPLICHVHDSFFVDIYKHNQNKIKKIFQHSKKLLPVSKFQANLILNFFPDYSNKIKIIYNGIDLEKFNTKIISKTNEKKTNKCVFVGHIDKQKGVDLIIKAFNIIKNSDITIDLYGNSDEISEFQKEINSFKLNEVIKFKGIISNDELANKLSEYSLFVLPSRFETFGIVLIEALASGLPVISTNTTAIPEIISNENVGFLVENGDFTNLAEKIKLALNKKWDKNYIRSYAEKFSDKNSVQEINNIYQNILEEIK